MMDSNNNTNQQYHHHYNFQPNQQHQHQQHQTFKSKPTVEENSNLDAFLESPQFLTDIYIKSLIDKGITLGIVWEVIKETLGRFLINIINNNSLDLEVNGINYSRLIDEEKFFEQLILYSIQVENSNNNKQHHGSSKNEFGDDYNENDEEDYETSNETTDQQHANEHEFELSQQFNRINMNTEAAKIINRPPVISSNLNTMAAAVAKKQTSMQQMPLTAQQKIQQEQDFITQSINRINDKSNLRPIIVDSNDVALSSHSNKQVFLFSRIKQVVDYFEKRNHQIYVILSSWRKEQIMASPLSNSASSLTNSVQNTTQQSSTTLQQQQQQQPLTPDQQALIEMEQKNQVYYTPSKRVGAKRIVCDDDSYMLKLCVAKMGIIVSNDNFKRFLNYSDDFKLVIEERVLMYSFIDNTFMPAEDPLGKNGPSLDNFLRFESFVNQQYMKRCPYRKKCTYGSKCKFWHPERGLHQGNQLFKTAHQSVLDEAQEQKMRLEIILNKNSYSTGNIINNQQHPYSVDSETTENDDEHNDENSIKILNRIKQQKHQYSGLMNSANIYNLHEFDSMKNSEQTWALNKADSDLTFINKTNQNQHVQSFQKIGLYSDKLHELRAMGPETSMKMLSLNGSNKSNIHHSKINHLNSAAIQMKTSSVYNQSSYNYSPNMLWDAMKSGSASNNKSKNDFDFESLNHQAGVQQQSYQQLESQNNNQNIVKNKLNESKKNEISEAFSLFAPIQSHNGSSSTPASVSPTLSNSNSGENLRAQLISQSLNPKLVDDVLNKYKGETDIEKLIFLARGISFSSDF